jgi:predicted kinase
VHALDRPVLVAIIGLCGAGKTTLGATLRPLLRSATILDSDDVLERLSTGHVATETSRYALYSGMAEIARAELNLRHDVIWCQPLPLHRGHPSHAGPSGRHGLFLLAESAGAGIAFIHCHARVPVLEERLRERSRASRSGRPWSEVLARMVSLWEPLSFDHLRVDTERPIRLPDLQAFVEGCRLTENSRRSLSLEGARLDHGAQIPP